MNQNEPGLIEPAQEVLEQRDVAERNRAILIDATPIPERVAGVREDRFAADRRRNLMPRHGESSGEGGRRLWLAPHVRLSEIAQGAHRRLKILFSIEKIGAEWWERLDDLANAASWNEARQIARRLMPLRIGKWDGGTRVGNGEETALRCHSIGVKVDCVPHGPLQSTLNRPNRRWR